MAKMQPQVDLDIGALFVEANQNALLRAKIRDRTEKIAARARRIDQAENAGRATIRTSYEVLPNGRFVANVETDDVSGEFGDSTRLRRRTLRRAGGSR